MSHYLTKPDLKKYWSYYAKMKNIESKIADITNMATSTAVINEVKYKIYY